MIVLTPGDSSFLGSVYYNQLRIFLDSISGGDGIRMIVGVYSAPKMDAEYNACHAALNFNSLSESLFNGCCTLHYFGCHMHAMHLREFESKKHQFNHIMAWPICWYYCQAQYTSHVVSQDNLEAHVKHEGRPH